MKSQKTYFYSATLLIATRLYSLDLYKMVSKNQTCVDEVKEKNVCEDTNIGEKSFNEKHTN